MNRYDWKYMEATVVKFPPFKKPKLSLVQYILKDAKECDERICKYAENYLFGETDEVSNNR